MSWQGLANNNTQSPTSIRHRKWRRRKMKKARFPPILLLMLMYSEGEIFKAFLSPSTFPLSPNLESCTHAYFPFTHFQFLKIFPLLRRPLPPTLQNILERRSEVGGYFFLSWDAAPQIDSEISKICGNACVSNSMYFPTIYACSIKGKSLCVGSNKQSIIIFFSPSAFASHAMVFLGRRKREEQACSFSHIPRKKSVSC